MGDQLYDQGERYIHLSASGTTVIRSTETRLMRVVLNTFIAGGSITLYNGVTTTASQAVAMIGTSAANIQRTYEYDVTLSGGLAVGIVSTPDVTIVYR